MKNMAKLNELLAFAETVSCKRKYLMDYFGNEKVPCGTCSSCLSDVPVKNVSDLALDIICLVRKTNEIYGMGYICSLLKGSNAKNIKEEHKSLEEFDSFDGNEQEIKKTIRQLLVLGVLEIDLISGFNNLKIKNHLEDEVFIVPVKKSKTKKIKYQEDLPEECQDIFNDLKSIRMKISKSRRIPPYMVLHDKSLKILATEKPRTIEEIRQLHGWGDKKINSYAKFFLDYFNN